MIKSVLARLGLVGVAKFELAFTSKDIPVCETRIVRKNGRPWSELVAIHPCDDRIDVEELKPQHRTH